MAAMHPPVVSADTKSQAEIALFSTIESQLDDKWVALHSVGLTYHGTKPWAEVDFVLVGPPGVLCLEVKGGRPGRTNGRWYTLDRNDERHDLRESPFQQAASASSALFAYLKDARVITRDTPVVYAVATPDVEFAVTGPDVDEALVYDQRDRPHPFSEYVDRVFRRWAERGLARPTPMSHGDRDAVLSAIRADFDLRPSIRARVDSSCDELLRLTQRQYSVLDGLVDNQRAVIRGGAGTGKTLLAVEEALRAADDGAEVLLCCFNKNLATELRKALPGRVTVRHLHGLMAEIVRDAGLRSKVPDADESDLFESIYPDLVLEAFLDRHDAPFDMIVVDEAQDLLLPAYMDVFDVLLRGGLKQGRWRFFLDANQDLYAATAPAALERLLTERPAQFRLTMNCRNTAAIGTATALLAGSDLSAVLEAEGPDVEYLWWNTPDQERQIISKRVRRLLHDGIDPDRVVVLSPVRRQNSALASGLISCPVELVSLETGSGGGIRFSTVSSFKGLESDVIVLIDVASLKGPAAARTLYVATSRAKALLICALPESERTAFDELAFDFGRRVSELDGPTSAGSG